MPFSRSFTFICIYLLLSLSDAAVGQNVGFGQVDDVSNILPVRERARYVNEVIEWRVEKLLPKLMRKHNIDMWFILDRENNKDPVAVTLYKKPFPGFLGRSVIFYNRPNGTGVERYRGGIPRLKTLIDELSPSRVGLNISELWNNGDGLTKGLYDRLVRELEDSVGRLVSAEDLSNEWLETKTKRELSVYRHVAGVTHDIISEAFSNKVIVPGITTVNDVSWWIAQRMTDLGIRALFYIVEVQRSPKDRTLYGNASVALGFNDDSKLNGDIVIQRGDIIHSDIGMEYLGLNTDNQHHAYVLRDGETDVPQGLKQALKNSNRLQDIFMSEFVEGRSGNEITRRTLERARSEGLEPMVYTHPIGYHQHSGGTIMGADSEFAQHNPLPKAEYPLHYNTVWSIELETITAIPEWGGMEVEVALEEQGAFTEERGTYFVDGRQTRWFVIR
jgi:hypothetical protein